HVPARIHHAGHGIVYNCARTGEVAGAVLRRWHIEHRRLRLTLAQTFVIEEEEHLVALIQELGNPHRPAYRSAELIAFEWRDGTAGIEEVFGVEVGIAQELEQRAVEFIGAAARR